MVMGGFVVLLPYSSHTCYGVVEYFSGAWNVSGCFSVVIFFLYAPQQLADKQEMIFYFTLYGYSIYLNF